MHATDPVQRLKLLLHELQSNPESFASDLDFHSELTDIFTSVRDLHTNYLLPAPYNGMSAFLPFIVEDCYDEHGACKFVVTRVASGFGDETFVPGVEIAYWNGMPIARAVRNNAQRYAGSNREARHARGVQTLTTRALSTTLPPDEEWVIVGYRTPAGKELELRFDWMVNAIPSFGGDSSEALNPAIASVMGIDIEQHLVQRVRASLFAPDKKDAGARVKAKLRRGESLGPLESA